MTLQEFHPFSQHFEGEGREGFPEELRLQIWEYAIELVKPRVVEIHRRRRKETSHKFDPFISSTPCPPLLHACHTSRIMMLKWWPLSFGDASHASRIPFNFDSDTLYLDSKVANENSFGQIVGLPERKDIKRVALVLDESGCKIGKKDLRWDIRRVGKMLNKSFPSLETLHWLDYEPIRNFHGEWRNREHYVQHFRIQIKNPDDVLPHFLCLSATEPALEPGVSNPLVRNPKTKLYRTFERHRGTWNWPQLESSTLKMEIVGAEVDSWGYRWNEELDDYKLRKEVQRLHGLEPQKRVWSVGSNGWVFCGSD